ncbi:translation initiation factor IF-2 subunit beta [Candidatus Parvarchaeota archaeon]|nr:translation initiation factor IF-2 subunit beta [Candidatus Parvarchaeota archaeon]
MTDYEALLSNVLKNKKETKADRFVPPQVEIFQSGQKTMIIVDKLTKYINRDIKHLAKFLMHELTAPGQIDETGRIIIGGRFSKKQVQEKIDSYLKTYVFCKQCNSPDTQMIKIDNNTFIKCLGCGAEYPVGRLK